MRPLRHLLIPSAGRISRRYSTQDLLEEFRAGAVDRLVLRLCNHRMLTPADFVTLEDGGVHLTKHGLRVFITAYEAHLSREFRRAGRTMTLRRCFQQQALALAKAVRDGEEYRPYALI